MMLAPILAEIRKFMRLTLFILVLFALAGVFGSTKEAHAFKWWTKKNEQKQVEPELQKDKIISVLAPHKALYDINLVSTRSGSQIMNISGQMFFEWRPGCEAWATDHRFSLFYEYADSPSMKIASDFSTFEQFDGQAFNFSARRSRNGDLYQELRGAASIERGQEGDVDYSLPEGLEFELEPDTLFPMAHTIDMIGAAKSGKKFHRSIVFDGSDDEGPVEINSFIGKNVTLDDASLSVTPAIDQDLLRTQAWKVRMAVFPTLKDEEFSDYEMDMVFHENGVISDMLVEYDNFSVTQKLVALEKLEGDFCK
ncbi:MAG: cell envelope integrity EipB family protein [Alphaproteobacteria bacterium]|nr:cell envelope integrity EipB family protein [Alphaproteobacteria bacterium]